MAHFAKTQGVQRVIFDQLVGLCLFFDRLSPHQDGTTLVEAAPEGWWYSACLPAGRLVVACVSDADFARQARLKFQDAWMRQLKRTHHTRERLEATTSRQGPTSYPAATQCLS